MSDINRVQLLGRLGADPEIRYTASGAAVANLRIATSEKWRDKQSGEQQERTEWHQVVAFGKTAEVCQNHLAKGLRVLVDGRLQTRKWQGQDGADRYTTEVVVDRLTLVDFAEKRGGGKQQQRTSQRQQSDGPPPADFDDLDKAPF